MLRGVDFDHQLVTSKDLGHFIATFSQKKSGVSKGCGVTCSGGNIYVQSGYMFTCGRLTEVSGVETIPVPEITSGQEYCRLVYEVDLSKSNSKEDFQQGEWKILTSYDSYPTPQQDDLDDHPADGIYQLKLAKFILTASGVTNFVDEREQFDVWLTGTLQPGSTTLTISDPSITADSIVETYTSDYQVQPDNVVARNGSIVYTFTAQSAAVQVKARIF